MGEDDKTHSQEIQDRIRDLAHSMWESAGRLQGLATEYWLPAEEEVLATMRAAAERLTLGEKPERAEEPETEAAPAAAAPPAAAPEPVETGATQAARTEESEHPKPKAAKPKKK
ncbi:MAG: DUF2934 domain-containing protein [Defluviicoccus sp.]